MEVASTGAFLDKVNTINDQEIGFENVNLEEIDNAIDEQERQAHKRYDNFDSEQLKELHEEYHKLVDGVVKEPSDTPGGSRTWSPQLERFKKMENLPIGWTCSFRN